MEWTHNGDHYDNILFLTIGYFVDQIRTYKKTISKLTISHEESKNATMHDGIYEQVFDVHRRGENG